MAPDLLAPTMGSAAVLALLSADQTLAAMARFEGALALAEADIGVIPAEAASMIASVAEIARLDAAKIAAGGPHGANIAIPFVKELTALVASKNADAARYVHFGATSQDVIDTATVLQSVAVLDCVLADLSRAEQAVARLAKTHRLTPMAGRTLLQQALPTTFGLKAAGLLDALMRHRQQLTDARTSIAVVQLGGAAGTLASLGDKGWAVNEALARHLGLAPALPWHGYRDRIVTLGSALASLAGTCSKFAHDVALMMQTEIGEVLEPSAPGRGGSSTLPHKRNPVLSTLIIAAAGQAAQALALLAHNQRVEHERAAGAWQGEWLALSNLLLTASGAIHRLAELTEGLEVNAQRMRQNLNATGGLILTEAVQMALAPKIGRQNAHGLIETIARKVALGEGVLRDLLLSEPTIAAHLSAAEIDALLDPGSYLGAAPAMVDAALARYHNTTKT